MKRTDKKIHSSSYQILEEEQRASLHHQVSAGTWKGMEIQLSGYKVWCRGSKGLPRMEMRLSLSYLTYRCSPWARLRCMATCVSNAVFWEVTVPSLSPEVYLIHYPPCQPVTHGYLLSSSLQAFDSLLLKCKMCGCKCPVWHEWL